VKYDTRELAQLSSRQAPSEAEWDARIAAGTPPAGARVVTLADPLTTSLLAEVARRSKTIEVSADQIDETHDLEPGASAPADDHG
jgi:hypothetical protein